MNECVQMCVFHHMFDEKKDSLCNIRHKYVWVYACISEYIVLSLQVSSGEALMDQLKFLFLLAPPLMIQFPGFRKGSYLLPQTDGLSWGLSGTYLFTVLQNSTGAERSACIWMPAESISWVCGEITLAKTRSELAPKFSSLKWNSTVWQENHGWRGCLLGGGCF